MNEELFKNMLAELYAPVFFVHPDGTIGYWNACAAEATGHSSADVQGRIFRDNFFQYHYLDPEEIGQRECPVSSVLESGMRREAEGYMRHAKGHLFPVSIRISPTHGPDRRLTGAVGTFSNNENALNARATIKDLQRELYVDELTRLSNRKFASMHLENLLEAQQQYQGRFGVLMLDIDHFKKVYDTWGHHTGDLVLKMVARCIASSLRPLDTPCRWGGEEFLVILPNAGKDRLRRIGERLRLLVEKSEVSVKGRSVSVTISVGGTLSQPEDCRESLVDRADKELYRSKAGGRNRVSIYR